MAQKYIKKNNRKDIQPNTTQKKVGVGYKYQRKQNKTNRDEDRQHNSKRREPPKNKKS